MSALLCAICRESLGIGSLNKSCTIPCGHVFHDHCIFNWLERSQTCPHCRVSSRPDQVIKLYFDLAEDSQVSELETLRNEVQRLKVSLDRTENDLKVKTEDCKSFYRQVSATQKTNETLRKEAKVLNTRIDKLKVIKLDYGRQKTELKLALSALERERAKSSQLSKDLQKFRKINTLLDGSLEEASNVINSEECVDFDTMKVCFITMKRDFRTLRQSEAKLKADYSSLFSANKILENNNASLIEKCSIQERIIEAYKSDLSTSSNVALSSPATSHHSKMEVDETNLETVPAKKVMLRRSPRNINKRPFRIENTIPNPRQLSYDGLGGHSAEDKFPSAKLKPCRIVSNRRK